MVSNVLAPSGLSLCSLVDWTAPSPVAAPIGKNSARHAYIALALFYFVRILFWSLAWRGALSTVFNESLGSAFFRSRCNGLTIGGRSRDQTAGPGQAFDGRARARGGRPIRWQGTDVPHAASTRWREAPGSVASDPDGSCFAGGIGAAFDGRARARGGRPIRWQGTDVPHAASTRCRDAPGSVASDPDGSCFAGGIGAASTDGREAASA